MRGNIELEISPKDLKDFKKAIRENPAFVQKESYKFMARSKAEYLSVILKSPWKLGQSGGGVPVATPETSGYYGGHLKKTHITKVKPYKMTITPMPNRKDPNYADYVHEGTRKMLARPWLNYAMNRKKGVVERLATDMLKKVTNQLAK